MGTIAHLRLLSNVDHLGDHAGGAPGGKDGWKIPTSSENDASSSIKPPFLPLGMNRSPRLADPEGQKRLLESTKKHQNQEARQKQMRPDKNQIIERNLESKTKNTGPVRRIQPKLVIHAGPMKTGTTYLQGKLGKRKTLRSLEVDNIVAVVNSYNFRFTKKLFEACLLSSATALSLSCQKRLDDFFDGLRNIAEKFMASRDDEIVPTLLLSVETYSQIPETVVATRFFLDRFSNSQILDGENNTVIEWSWDMHVLLAYRKIYSWYPSMYHQYRKGLMYRSGMGRYRGFLPDEMEVDGKTILMAKESDKGASNAQLTFPDWMQGMMNFVQRDEGGEIESKEDGQSELFARDTVGVIRFYERHLRGDTNDGNLTVSKAQNRIHLVDFEASDLEQEFFCHSVLNATKTCSVVAERRRNAIANGDNTTGKRANVLRMLLDEDLLAMEAYRMGLFVPTDGNGGADKSGLTKSRIDQTMRTRKQMSGNVKRHGLSVFLRDVFEADSSHLKGPAANVNRTLLATARVCLNQFQWEWMWNRSLWIDERIGRYFSSNKSQITGDADSTTNRIHNLQTEMRSLILDQGKGCSLDAQTLLQDKSWRHLLSSSAFCLANTSRCVASNAGS